jgi:3-oxoacyl-[acyl-carrier protein] reductase
MQAMNASDRSLAGKVAVVTGSGRNIGQAIAVALARAGADVVLNGRRDSAQLQAVAEEVRSGGVRCIVIAADVSVPEQVDALVAHSLDQLGRIDIAVSNVGLRLHQPFLEISHEDWRRTIETSLSSAFYLAKAVLPGMKAQGFGRLIHISGRDGFFPMPNRAHNITAKAGLHALAKAIAVEFGPFGITANTVAPGLIDTDRDLAQYPDYADRVRERVARMPARRIGHTDDVAQVCVDIAAGGNFMTGQLIHVNGGEFMY